jgi:hypothetical protein
MLGWIREKFGAVVIGGIITFIAFVFIFSGVFSPKATRGLHEGAVAGTVNGDAISITEFNRELNRRLEFFKAIAGGKISEEQLKMFRVREGVFQELVNKKLMVQEAGRQGLIASDEELRDKISEIPAFQKTGKFDLLTYRQVLEANNYSPTSFERLVREDISLQQWDSFFRDRVRVSNEEIKKEFLLKQDKRDLKYIMLTPETTQKNVSIDPSEVQKFLGDSGKLNIAKMKYEEGKKGPYKGQSFDQAKEGIARSVLASEKLGEIQKMNDQLADQVVAAMTAEKSSDAKVNQILKPYNIQVKATGWIVRQGFFIPGLGEVRDIASEVFATQSKQGSKAKKYTLPGRTIVAVVTDVQKPEIGKLNVERDGLMQQIASKKSKELQQEWLKKLVGKAKVDTNSAVVGADQAM